MVVGAALTPLFWGLGTTVIFLYYAYKENISDRSSLVLGLMIFGLLGTLAGSISGGMTALLNLPVFLSALLGGGVSLIILTCLVASISGQGATGNDTIALVVFFALPTILTAASCAATAKFFYKPECKKYNTELYFVSKKGSFVT